jgi:Tfp pilus assembly protein PilE
LAFSLYPSAFPVRRHGFLLIEALIYVAVLAVALAAR